MLTMLTKKELAAAYGCHPNTISNRLKHLGVEPNKRIPPKVLQFIYEELGEPTELAPNTKKNPAPKRYNAN
jgi:hypothetical protein